MRVSEAISGADGLRPGNNIDVQIKRRWLLSLDKKIYSDIILKHEGEVPPPVNYLSCDAELLLPDTDFEVYIWYLISQIDSALGESARHNTSAERFNYLFSSASARYKREHKPLQPNKVHNVMKARGI